ncbi:MAG: metallophosphoesterase family protein [Sulfolobales archaeon]
MSTVLKFLAFGDSHVPRYFSLVVSSVNSLVGFRPDIVLLAGDIVDRGDVSGFEFVRSFLRSKYGSEVPILSVFGNEEYMDRQSIFRERYRDIIWLDDSCWVGNLSCCKLCVYGSRGSLEKLTPWQSRNASFLKDLYEKRIYLARENLLKLRRECDIVILLMHYSPTYLTLEGEPENIYKFLGHRGYEKIIYETKPDLVIHAHSHNSKKWFAKINSSYVINVSVPAVKSVIAGLIRRFSGEISLEIITSHERKIL